MKKDTGSYKIIVNRVFTSLPHFAILILAGLMASCVAAYGQHTYYIAASGSDANTSTQAQAKTTPWLHAPGMAGCTSNCASYNPVPGDRFIFRGGDTWHYAAAAGSPVGIPWNWNWSGSQASPIYIGVDTTWYAGTSWVRPILNADNPVTSTPVSACKYDESTVTLLNLNNANVTLDNFEILGLCWSGNQNNSGSNICCAAYVGKGAPPNPVNIIISNVYIHGWSHKTFNCSGGSSGTCDGAQGITGDSHSNGGEGNQIAGVVIDGSDSDGTSLSANLWDCYDIHDSVIRYASQGTVCNNMHTFHDNLIEYISESSDGYTHSNGFEFNSEWAGTNTVYNNVVRHITAAVTGWVNPAQVDYHFNNLVFDTLGQGWDVDATGGGSNLYFYNNTIEGGGVGSSAGWEGVLQNNVFINGGVTGSPKSNTNSINWSTTQATAAGYTASNDYAPTSANCNGTSPCPVGAGANLTSACTAAPALCSASTNACAYSSTTHSVTCPSSTPTPRPSTGPWDDGAFEYLGNPLTPPSALRITVQ